MRLHFPTTISEAVSLRKETNGSYIAGGTVLMVNKVIGKPVSEDLIALERIPELHEIVETSTTIEVGAACSFSQIMACEAVRKYCNALYQGASQVGGPQVRNRGTIGGNLGCGTPASDAVAPILVLDPQIVMEEDLIVKFIFRKDECVRSAFRKVGKRSALAVSAVSIAVSAKPCSDSDCGAGRACWAVRVAVGSCAPKVVFCEKTSACLSSGGTIEQAKDILMTEISPIDDRWESAEYRRAVCRNLLEDLYREVTA